MPRLLAADAQRSDDPDLEAPAKAPATEITAIGTAVISVFRIGGLS